MAEIYNKAARKRIEAAVKRIERMPLSAAPQRKFYPRGNGQGGLYLAKTQQAAQANAFISVKFLKTDGVTVYGDAFNAQFDFVDGSTAANACDPRVASGVPIKIAYLCGVWRVVSPTLTKGASDCT